VTSTLSTDELAQEYIRARIEGVPVTVKHLAAEHGRSYDALRKAAAKGKWSARAALAVAERDAAVAKEIADRNAMTSLLLVQSVETEVQVRRRHARLARCLQEAALQRLIAITPDELSVKVAVDMLKIGVEVEREALGLGDVVPVLHDEADALRLREAVESAKKILERHARAGDFGNVAKQAYDPPVKRSHVNGEEVGSHCNQLQ